MSRFADIATLRSLAFVQNDEGGVLKEVEETEVFCNRFTVNLETRMTGAADGLRGLVEIQLRSCDYDGQQEVVFNDTVYTVRDAYDSGEFTRLTLVRRLGDE